MRTWTARGDQTLPAMHVIPYEVVGSLIIFTHQIGNRAVGQAVQ